MSAAVGNVTDCHTIGCAATCSGINEMSATMTQPRQSDCDGRSVQHHHRANCNPIRFSAEKTNALNLSTAISGRKPECRVNSHQFSRPDRVQLHRPGSVDGEQARSDKRGKLKPVTEKPRAAPAAIWQVSNHPDAWLRQVQGTESIYYRAIGSAEALMEKAEALEQAWMKGVASDVAKLILRQRPT